MLTACHGEPAGLLQASEPPATAGPARGIDLAIDASDILNELKGSRVDFVVRYYRHPESRWPTLSRAEAQRLSALGMNIVALWEWHSGDPAYFSYASGHADAIAAYRQAMGIGQPAGSAIYFAVDFNPRAQEIEPVRQYFRGVAAGLSAAGTGMARYKVGVYGSGAVCDAVKRDGLAQYSWLSNSTAWSGSLAYDGWNIRQGGRLAGLSFEHDSDRARAEYGGFRLAPAGAAGGGLRASESGAR
jgi:hypothetical protein